MHKKCEQCGHDIAALHVLRLDSIPPAPVSRGLGLAETVRPQGMAALAACDVCGVHYRSAP